MSIKKPIYIDEIYGGIGQQNIYSRVWRAWGIDDNGRLFWLVDNRYECAYPLDADTEKQIRRLCARQYPGHPILYRKDLLNEQTSA